MPLKIIREMIFEKTVMYRTLQLVNCVYIYTHYIGIDTNNRCEIHKIVDKMYIQCMEYAHYTVLTQCNGCI